MKTYLEEIFGPIPINNKLWTGSATTLARACIAADNFVQQFLAKETIGKLFDAQTAQEVPAKDASRTRLRTMQEWCHLFGHGDGGKEVGPNFVAGSKHCNTEQLALELSHRLYDRKSKQVTVSAYLMPFKPILMASNLAGFLDFLQKKFKETGDKALHVLEQELSVVVTNVDAGDPVISRIRGAVDLYYGADPKGNYSFLIGEKELANEQELFFSTAGTDEERKHLAEQLADHFYFVWPIAWAIRYRVFVRKEKDATTPGTDFRNKDDDDDDDDTKDEKTNPMVNAPEASSFTWTKAIDHFFAGQREEMDYNEFRMLQWYFRLEMAKIISDSEFARVTEQFEERLSAAIALRGGGDQQ
jgi:hypothetical protein